MKITRHSESIEESRRKIDAAGIKMSSPRQQAKVGRVMHEFGSGTLRSSSGQKVTNQKQAVAIALSESRRMKRSGKR